MQDLLTEKWIENVSSGDHTCDVAALSLQNRLGAVLTLLPLVVEKSESDPEFIHALRIWSRRTSVALILYKDLLPKRRCSWIKKRLKRIRRGTNAARDCDVLIQWLKKDVTRAGGGCWLELVRKEREALQSTVVATCERLTHSRRFARRIDKLLKRVSSSQETKRKVGRERFGDWARQKLVHLVHKFFLAIPSDRANEQAFHRFRIRGKKLRYALELFGAVFSEEVRTSLYAAMQEFQDHLGEMNDRAVAISRLDRLLDSTDDKSEVVVWQQLLEDEQSGLQEAREEFWDKTLPRIQVDLRNGFQAMLGPSFQPKHLGRHRSSSPAWN
jgi:CHAD domain-containing protein